MRYVPIAMAVVCVLAAVVTAKYRPAFWRATLTLLAAPIVLGILNGLGFLYSEFQNNNNGEYFDTLTGVVDLPYAVEMFMVAAVATFTVTYALEFIVYLVCRSVLRRFPV